MATPRWAQVQLTLPPAKRGCHIITQRVTKAIEEPMRSIDVGIAHIFVQHTSCSLMLNENADPHVRADMETFMTRVVPEGPSAPWQHTDEGYDDMPAHVKAAMFGSSLTLPIRNGRLALGTWQGVWLAEHRNEPTSRSLIITLQGMGGAPQS